MAIQTAIIIGCGPFVSTSLAKWLAPNYTLGLVSRKQESLDKLVSAVKSSTPAAKVFSTTADASVPKDLTSALDSLTEKLGGRVDVLVYHAARVAPSDLLTVSPEDLKNDFDICAIGTLVAGQWFVKHHQSQKRENGRSKPLLLITGGTLDRSPSPAHASLSTAKSASQNIAKMLAAVLPDRGIQVGQPLIVEPIIPKEDGSGYQTKSDPDVIVEKIFKPYFEDNEKGVGEDAWQAERIW